MRAPAPHLGRPSYSLYVTMCARPHARFACRLLGIRCGARILYPIPSTSPTGTTHSRISTPRAIPLAARIFRGIRLQILPAGRFLYARVRVCACTTCAYASTCIHDYVRQKLPARLRAPVHAPPHAPPHDHWHPHLHTCTQVMQCVYASRTWHCPCLPFPGTTTSVRALPHDT